MRRRAVDVVGPAHQAVADVTQDQIARVGDAQPFAAEAAHLQARDAVSHQQGDVAVVGVLARPRLGRGSRARNGGGIVQEPQHRRGAIDHGVEEVLVLKAEVEAEAVVQHPTDLQATVVVIQHQRPPAGQIRPEVHAAQGPALAYLQRVRRQLQADVERLLAVHAPRRIQAFAFQAHIASVVWGTFDRQGVLVDQGLDEEAPGGVEQRGPPGPVHAVARNAEEADLAAGRPQTGGRLAAFGRGPVSQLL